MSYDKSDKKPVMVKALEASMGIVSIAAKAAGIHRDSHYRWMKEDEKYRNAVEGVDEIRLDFVESKLYKKIEEGDARCITWFLERKAKKRGYHNEGIIVDMQKVERAIITLPGGQTLDI